MNLKITWERKPQKTEGQQIEDLAAETSQALCEGKKDKALKLFGKVEQMFDKGNEYTRDIIANKFIFPVTQLLEMNFSWGKEYLKLLPEHLKEEYRSQTYSLGV